MSEPHRKPIYDIGQFTFANMTERALLPLAGGKARLSHGHDAEGNIESEDIDNRGRIIERDNPPDHPLGPPAGWALSFMLRKSRDLRGERGLDPAFVGGAMTVFADLHLAFIGTAAHYGKLLDVEALRKSSPQGQRIYDLLQEWTDQPEHRDRRYRPEGWAYPQELAAELATLDKIPLKVGRGEPVWVDNIPITTPPTASRPEKTVPLAHALLALQKNALALGGRIKEENDFISDAIHEFSRIFMTTEVIYPQLAELLRREGINNPEDVLKERKLEFDAARADEMLSKHAPFLKLSAVIAPLTGRDGTEKETSDLLGLINEQTEYAPPILHAAHGARLLEGILYYITEHQDGIREKGTTAREKGLDPAEIKRHLRMTARENPFDVAALENHPQVEKLLEETRKHVARHSATEFPDKPLERALATWDRALSAQLNEGLNADAIGKMADDLGRHASDHKPESQRVKEWRDRLEADARRDIPPLP